MTPVGFSFLFFLSPTISFSQGFYNATTPAALRTGAYSNLQTDVFSFTANQASLSEIKNISMGIYGERRFMLSELSHYLAAIAWPGSSGNFGFKGGYFGSADYHESQAGIAYARKMGSKLDIGVQFNYNSIKIPAYGNIAAIGFEAGVILHLTDLLQTGIYINNPFSGWNTGGDKAYPRIYGLGLGYDVSNKIFLGAEIIHEEWQAINVNLSFQYRIVNQFLLGAGLSTNVSAGWLEFSFSWKAFQAGIISSFHPQLGITPGFQLVVHRENIGK